MAVQDVAPIAREVAEQLGEAARCQGGRAELLGERAGATPDAGPTGDAERIVEFGVGVTVLVGGRGRSGDRLRLERGGRGRHALAELLRTIGGVALRGGLGAERVELGDRRPRRVSLQRALLSVEASDVRLGRVARARRRVLARALGVEQRPGVA